jgi:cation diffusion facilitator CzcD-associated flavoprotein CzcO
VGGTWWHNRYPGAECDVKSHLYSFSFELKTDWSRPFAGQAEILTYLQHVAHTYGLQPYVRFGHTVRAAHWQEADSHWQVETSDGQLFRAPVVISGLPNLFMLYGPNTNNGLIISMLEIQVDYILRQIKRLARERLAFIDLRPDAQVFEAHRAPV